MNVSGVIRYLKGIQKILCCKDNEEAASLGFHLLEEGEYDQVAAFAYCFEEGIFVEKDLETSIDLWRYLSNCCGNIDYVARSKEVLLNLSDGDGDSSSVPKSEEEAHNAALEELSFTMDFVKRMSLERDVDEFAKRISSEGS